jgi:hypothetical protein
MLGSKITIVHATTNLALRAEFEAKLRRVKEHAAQGRTALARQLSVTRLGHSLSRGVGRRLSAVTVSQSVKHTEHRTSII